MAEECKHLRRDSGWTHVDYKCAVTNEKVSEEHYKKWCSGWNHLECVDFKKEEPTTGCFITTIVVDTLGYKDNVSYLQTLRYFRNEVLQKTDQYREILATYDVVGPEISKRIQEDKNRKQISLNLFNLGISKVCKLIEEKKEKEAIELYMDMTKLLIQGYGINNNVSEEYLDNMDVKNSGHGRLALIK